MISAYGAAQWCGVMFGIQTMPATLYVALLTDLPGDSWDGTTLQALEPVDTAYARQPLAVGGGSPGFAQSDNGLVYNGPALTFGPPTTDWGVISHYALLDDPQAGNLYCADDFIADVPASIGVPCQIATASMFFALSVQVPSIEGD